MATPDGTDSDLPYEVYDITNCVAIYYEKDARAGMPSLGKEKVLNPDFKESEDAESFKETVKCIYGLSLKYGNKQSFSFTDTWTKENKAVYLLRKETL